MQNNSEIINNIIQHYGYLAMFVGLIFEAFILTGFLVPGTVILIVGGYASAEGNLSYVLSLSVSLIGTLIGDNISFMLGRSRFCKYKILDRYRDKANSLKLSSRWYLYLFQFTSLTRALVPFTLGISNLAISKWLAINTIAGVIFVITFFGIGVVSCLILKALNTSLSIGNYIQYVFNIMLLFIVLKIIMKKLKTKSSCQVKEN